jgi:propionyl-CoA carboxylase alpha chain
MITSLLVANRGEIARRVFRTCRRMGIGTIAVYSDADSGAPHAREADIGVRLPGTTATDTYLRADLIIEAARAAGAAAVHPGYGFLAENAAFARAVIDAGLLWIGPSPEAIEAMGSKIAAKKLMAASGVPVLAELDLAAVTEADLPMLIKASAGGGGRGMRVVESLPQLAAQLEAARAEAAAAFGDPAVFCEPFLTTGRHIEVQVIADRHGTVWTLGERECSIQRRHQKIVEETPSPMVGPQLREQLLAAAADATRAIGYEGAGTVEFLARPDGSFFFLEMNTRLQVEHPVTEAVTGLDLVRWQIAVALDDRLPPTPPPAEGHAIEVRLYAEDPAHAWRPQSGTLHAFAVPGVEATFQPHRGLRLDAGVEPGSTVGVSYDPMLAKVIGWAPTRDEAAQALASALAATRLHGLVTNRDLLVRILRHPSFRAGDFDTGFLSRFADDLFQPLADQRTVELSAVAAALASAAAARADAKVLKGLPSGWRNLPSAPQRRRYRHGEATIDVAYQGHTVESAISTGEAVTAGEVTPGRVELTIGRLRHAFDVAFHGDQVYVDSPLGAVTLTAEERFPARTTEERPGSLAAPMPGTVVRVAVAVGDQVTAGQPLLWLEAMKMQHEVLAPTTGVVAELAAREGLQVEVGTVLIVLTNEIVLTKEEE